MKTFNTTFFDISKYIFLRTDFKFLKQINNIPSKNFIKIGNLFNLSRGIVMNKEYLIENSGEYPVYSSQTEDEGIFGYIDTYMFDGEYLTWTTDGYAGNVFYRNGKFNCTNVCGIAELKNKKYKDFFNLKFLSYQLNTITQSYVSVASGNPKLMNNVFAEIKIPLIPLSIQNSTIEKITPIENKIRELKEQIIDQKLIINQVFSREFGFDMEEFENIKKKEKIYFIDFYSFSNNKDLRNSVKFHKKSYKYLINFLKNKKFKSLKNYVNETITLGSGIGQNDIEENGEYYYISMAELKNYTIDLENAKKIKGSFFNTKKEKSIKYNDIIIARSGEGTIGKCAIIEDEDIEGINADFTIKVRIDKNVYNSKFAYYYFCSFIFQYMIEINKKGLGNNTNIFPSQIQDFLIPDIPLSHQQKIVDEIKEKIDKQNEIRKLIDMERQKIDGLIEEILL